MEGVLEVLIERSVEWTKVDRGGDLPPIVSPLLEELFGVDGGYYLYLHQLLETSSRVVVHHPFGINVGQQELLQRQVERGKWFYRLPHLLPLSQWVPIEAFPSEWAEFCQQLGLSVAGVWPLEVRERVAGAVILGKRRTPDHLEQENRLLTLFVKQLSMILGLVVERRDAEISSQVDPLTGLSNRRGFMTKWERWSAEHLANAKSITVGILDVDGFKEINDREGHWIGDQILQEIAVQLKSIISGYGLCARWGGDEFVFVTAHSGEPQGVVADLSMQMRDALPNVSFGAAVLGVDGYDFDGCLMVADQRMYKSKSDRAAEHKVRRKRRIDVART